MAMATNYSNNGGEGRLINPWVLHFQKMGLELKCPLCLSLFNRPTLFPCDHIFCSSCVPRSAELGSKCPTCNEAYMDQDLRPASYIDNMVAIYRSLDVSFSNMFQPTSPGVLEQCQAPVKIDTGGAMLSKEPVLEDNSKNGHPVISLTANKRVHVCSNIPFEDDGSKRLKPDVGFVTLNGKANPLAKSRSASIESVDCGTATMGLTQGSEHADLFENVEKHMGKRPKEQNFDDEANQSSPVTQDLERNLKRQKQNDESAEIFNTQLPIEPVVSSGAQGQMISEPTVSCNSVCGFCQSSGVSEDTGEMLHYIHGNPVVGHKVNNPNAVHVHAKCIEWAPQVYYVGETVKNLSKELARGVKLKCFKCGLKGAALGCYSKCCRRTYHVPCALKDDCRWETEEFLMLCPAHAKQKFPYEQKTKLKNQALNNQPLQAPLLSKPSNLCEGPEGLPKETKEWVLCGSALSSAEKLLLMKFGRTFGVTVSKFWRPEVTHVIAATDANGACTRTLKILSTILSGGWVLNINWVKACLEANHPVGEEPYEVSNDSHGCCDGPKTGRLRALSNEPKLFEGSKFYFSGDFVEGYKRDLQNLVSRGGGVVLNSKEDLVSCSRDDQGAPSTILIVYNIDPPQGCKLGEEVSIIWERLNEAEDLAAKIGSRVVTHMWILESIASCKLQPKVI